MITDVEKRRLKPYHGIIIFILVILFFLFAAAPIQQRLGLYGVALTEVGIILFAFIPAIILKADLKEIFPIKRPKFRQIAGVTVLWIGAFLAATLVSLITGYFFPKGLSETNGYLVDTFTSAPIWVSILIIAVMPAICEEALMRGFVQSSFHVIKRKWVLVLLIGFLFGIFHLDPYRFLPTAILGMFLAYIMIETKNILLPALFHLINNAYSTSMSFLVSPISTDSQLNISIIMIASYLIIGASIPFLLIIGNRLLHQKQKEQELSEEELALKKKRARKSKLRAGILAAVMFLVGSVMTAANSSLTSPVFNVNLTQSINCDTNELDMPLTIKRSGTYNMNINVGNQRGLIDIRIVNDMGDVKYQSSCLSMTASYTDLKLDEGSYHVKVGFHLDDIEEYYKQMGYSFDDKLKENFHLTGDLEEYAPFSLKLEIW